MSPRGGPLPSAAEPGEPDLFPRLVGRFRRDLRALVEGEEDRILVAVSGGGDSLALLLLAHAAIGGRCHAATIDHGLRRASGDEARFVAGVCAARGIDHAIMTGPLPARAGGTANLSARARALRYQLLEARAAQIGSAWIATAHHAEDQLETVTMRLNRGAGLAGLAGIRRRSGRVIRPLLGWRRADLAAVVAGSGIVAVADPSNVDDRFDRARLRKALAEVDWLDVARIGHSARVLGEAEDALAWSSARLFAERRTAEGPGLTLDVTGLPAEHVRRLVLRCIETLEPAERAGTATGPAIARLIASLSAGRPAMIGDTLVAVERPDGERVRWRFAAAAPRRGA